MILGAVACDEQGVTDIDDLMSPEDSVEVTGEGMQITDICFSDDYKVMTLSARLLHDIGAYDLSDTASVYAEAHQMKKLLSGKEISESQPVVTNVKNVSREELSKVDLKLLVLVDLSLPQSLVDAERTAVREIRNHLGQRVLCLAFMQGDNVSETYEATDYIIDNYFVHHNPSFVYLYRGMLAKLAEFQDVNTLVGHARYKSMVVLSGGKTYVDDLPVDPKHFEMQQLLADKAAELSRTIRVYYANFSEEPAEPTTDEEMPMTPTIPMHSQSSDANILQYFCKDMGGLYQDKFKWPAMEEDLLRDYNINYANYVITLEQPDKKVFRGSRHNLQVMFRDTSNDDLIVQGSTFFYLGSVFDPIIVRGSSMLDVIIQGMLTVLVILLITYLVLQLLEPFIRYKYFKRKYVFEYGGNNMSVNGQMLAESCYLCKAPFEEGELVVTKCKHTMHKQCWDENEYHCPEHGRHCKEGSHYYNSHNLYDPRNALFYMKWVLIAILAGFTAWLFFITVRHQYSSFAIEQLVVTIMGLKAGTKEADLAISEYGSHLSFMPAFGLLVSFFVTFFLTFLTVLRRQWSLRIAEMLLRAVFAGIASFVSCLLFSAISITFHIDSNLFLIDWIPWAFISWIIMFAITLNTRSKIRRIYFIAAFLVGFLSMLVWSALYNRSFMDYRVSLLMCFVTYAVGIAICIARVTPKSERYFLHVEGAVKEMDIALYKWMRQSPDHVVTIGRSVDCSIQLSWDMNGKVAPLQAEIRQHVGSMRLVALEDGVYVDNDKPLPIGKEVWLYHGRRFTIGNTMFTYIEKDL